MKHTMMRAAVAATLGFAALAANAGTVGIAAGAVYAAEYVNATSLINIPTITFTTANVINDGSTVYVHVRFDAGTVTGAATPTGVTVKTFYNGSQTNTANTPVKTTIGAVDTDGLGYTLAVQAVSGQGGIPAGTQINFYGGTVSGSSLSTALAGGGAVNTQVGYTTTAGDYSAVTTWAEAPTAKQPLITSQTSLSSTVVTSAATKAGIYTVAENQVVNAAGGKLSQVVSSTNPVTYAASAGILNLGEISFAVKTSVVTPTGATPSLADFGNANIVATGDFSAANVANTGAGSVFLSGTQSCAASVAAATFSNNFTTATFNNVAIQAAGTANPLYLCYTIGTSSVSLPAPTQYTLGNSTVLAGVNTVQVAFPAATNVYKLVSNGASVLIPSLVSPSAAFGTYLRVVNTGSLATPIKVALYNSTTGVLGTPVTVISNLAPGASTNVDATTLYNLLGANTGTWFGVSVTGATSSLAVQSLLANSTSGVITEIGHFNTTTLNSN